MREMPAADRSFKAIPHQRSRKSLDFAKERETLVTSTYLTIEPVACHFRTSPTSRLWNINRQSLSVCLPLTHLNTGTGYADTWQVRYAISV